MTPEGRIKQRVKAILTDRGAWWTMPSGNAYGRRGVPDFLVLYRGQFMAIETKAPGGRPTSWQLREMSHIILHGGRALVVGHNDESWSRLEDELDAMKNGIPVDPEA